MTGVIVDFGIAVFLAWQGCMLLWAICGSIWGNTRTVQERARWTGAIVLTTNVLWVVGFIWWWTS